MCLTRERVALSWLESIGHLINFAEYSLLFPFAAVSFEAICTSSQVWILKTPTLFPCLVAMHKLNQVTFNTTCCMGHLRSRTRLLF